MALNNETQMEQFFFSLPRAERAIIINYGIILRLSHLKKQLFLAKSKIQHFAEKYDTTLIQLETVGLPDDAGYEMHEDYVMWHHWNTVVDKTTREISVLEPVAQQGYYTRDLAYAGC